MEVDITGQRFGELTAMHRFVASVETKVRWVFRCDCGSESIMRKGRVTSGRAKRCNECRLSRLTKHGQSRSREYHKFNQAKARCTNPKNARYPGYGGRGIGWRFESYEQALAELGPCPAGMTLDRINNNGHYEPGNVRWATWSQQFASRRPWNWRKEHVEKISGENSPFFLHHVSSEEVARLHAEGKSISEIGRMFGVGSTTIRRRLKKMEVLAQAA